MSEPSTIVFPSHGLPEPVVVSIAAKLISPLQDFKEPKVSPDGVWRIDLFEGSVTIKFDGPTVELTTHVVGDGDYFAFFIDSTMQAAAREMKASSEDILRYAIGIFAGAVKEIDKRRAKMYGLTAGAIGIRDREFAGNVIAAATANDRVRDAYDKAIEALVKTAVKEKVDLSEFLKFGIAKPV